ncbi:CARDB domain-containing protein [Nocardioides sp. W7]|uniref:CARDB domain-containing protein n=1 Tax=Nocardioides sp. W7 TaxID=2931390 RepID=UPI001FD241EB|nr:CARDB domain-containing protein [Nocardioides sp. W7]
MSSRLPVLVASVALAATLLPAGPAGAARPKAPDLVVASASLPVRTVAPGATVRVPHTLRNSGTAKARRSTTRVHLVAGRAAVPVAGRAVGALKPRKRTRPATVAFRVPVTLATGSYAVRVCADGQRKVKERNERNNCRVAGTLQVQRPTTPPPAPPTPQIPAMDPGETVLDSFATTRDWPADEDDALGYLKIFCQSAYPARAFSLPDAVASLRSRLTQDAAAGMAALAASPSYDDVVGLQQLATAGVAQGSPGLALAALLRAADLEPTIGTHLVNAASLAVSLSMPNEAVALLDAAASRTFRTPAMGIPQQAIAATVRGQALVMTGRAELARPWFLAARAAAPVLTEAEAGLATIEACAGDDVKAARLVRKSRQRTQEKTAPEQEVARPEPLSQIDLGAGRTTHLRQVPLPVSPDRAVAMIDGYQAILDHNFTEIDDHNARANALDVLLDAADATSTEAERERRHDLISLSYTATSPEIEALENQVDRILDDLTEQKEAFWGGGTGEAPYTYGEIQDDAFAACDDTPCYTKYMNDHCRPALRSEHQHWLALMQEYQDTENERIALLSQLMSSIAAHVAEPAGHDLIILGIERLEATTHTGIATRGWVWARDAQVRSDHCVEPLPVEGVDAEDEPDAESAGACSEEAKKISFKFGLGPSEMKVNCEKVQQEFSAEVLPLLNAFAEISYDFRSGTMTIVAGSKAKGGVGGVEGSFKSGVYVTVDTRGGGSIKDVGWQVGPEVTASAGGLEVEVYKDEMDISFIAGLKGD